MKKSTLIVLFMMGVLVIGSLMLPGCTDYLQENVKGDQTVNQKPIVYFVNVPPDGYKTSVNPAIHWVGTDRDGLVTMFRYIVVTEEEMGGPGVDPAAYALSTLPSLPEADWTYLDVVVDDPKTTNIIPAQASLDDPVNKYVRQFIFVQAFDDLGLGSDVVFKEIYRNDYPPDTRVFAVDTGRTYINAATPGAIGTGVKVSWEGSDPDQEDTLFEFEWKVYGPYDSATFEEIQDSFVKPVFLSNDAHLYPIEDGGIIYIVDTTYGESGIKVDTIETIIVDTISHSNFYGIYDTIFDIDDPDFVNNTRYNKLIETSGPASDPWVTNQTDSLYNLYQYEPMDSTDVRNFMFWVRGRDAAEVADLTPSFTKFRSLEPKFERDIIVLDFNNTRMITRYVAPYIDTTYKRWDPDLVDSVMVYPAVKYWSDVIDSWSEASGLNIEFSARPPYYIDEDYIMVKRASNRVSLKQLLSHKLMILYNDDITAAGITDGIVPTSNLGANVYIAIDAGVNAFLTMRSPIKGTRNSYVDFELVPDDKYSRYFGVSSVIYSSWGAFAFVLDQPEPTSPDFYQTRRIEDFVGVYGMTDDLNVSWPDINIDTVLLRDRYWWNYQIGETMDTLPGHTPNWYQHFESPYKWGGARDFEVRQMPLPDGLRALPEVDWAVRTYGTQIMFLYKSWYGRSHPLGEQYSFEGSPVGHSYNSGVYKTVHWSFTTLAMDTIPMQQVLNNVLDWLYEPNLFQPVSKVRYSDAKAPISISTARKQYWEDVKENMLDEDAKVSYRAIGKWR